MRKCIILFLITGILWAQTDFDKLVYKDGFIYLGEFSTIDKDDVFFKPNDAYSFQSIPVSRIETLEKSDGGLIIALGQEIQQKYLKSSKNNHSSKTLEQNSVLSKNNLTIGIIDDRTGWSILGYTYDFKQTDSYELFIGAGTMLSALSPTIGVQKYYRKSRLSVSSVLSTKIIFGQSYAELNPDEIGIMFYPFFEFDFHMLLEHSTSLTLEYNLFKRAQIKCGFVGVMVINDENDYYGFRPFAGINFRI